MKFIKFRRLRRLKNMYQKIKRIFSFKTDKKSNSPSLPKSPRRKAKPVCAEDLDDNQWRFSYVRASNSLHRYKSRNSSAGSLGSSREDLLDRPIISPRKKRINVAKRTCKKYKSGNSSSEDLLYDESDCTEEPLSSGMPETDGSVFSSQENLFKPATKCSANVSRFLWRQSFDKKRKGSGSQSQRRSPSPQILESSIELHQPPEEGEHTTDKSAPVSPRREGRQNYSDSDHKELHRLSPGDTAVPEISLCAVPQPILSDNTWPIRYRVQMAVVRTIHRLVNHIESVKEHVEVLENKCILLKETLCNLQQDNDVLEEKISRLEKQSEESEHSRNQKYNSNGLPSVEQVHGDLTAGKALLSQMNTVKKKSRRPSLFNFVAILTVTAIVWDIRSAGSFKGSKLGQTIERFGLTPYLVIAGEYAKAAFIHSYRWCATNLPIYYSRGCELAGPYLLLLLEKVEWVLAYVWAAMDSATLYIPPIKEKMESMLPGATSSLSYYGGVAVQSLQDGFLYVQNVSSPYLAQAHDYVSTTIFVGPLAPEKLQEYVVGAAQYVSELFLQLHGALVRVLEEANNATKAS